MIRSSQYTLKLWPLNEEGGKQMKEEGFQLRPLYLKIILTVAEVSIYAYAWRSRFYRRSNIRKQFIGCSLDWHFSKCTNHCAIHITVGKRPKMVRRSLKHQ